MNASNSVSKEKLVFVDFIRSNRNLCRFVPQSLTSRFHILVFFNAVHSLLVSTLPLCLCCVSLNVFYSLCQSAAALSRLFGLSWVEWGQGSEKIIPHNPSLPGQVTVLFTARTHLHKHAYTRTCVHAQSSMGSAWKSGVFVPLGS